MKLLHLLYIEKKVQFPAPWESKVPKRHKCNCLLGELHHAKMISSNFQKEVQNIKEKFSKANFPLRFIYSAVAQFSNSTYKIMKERKKMK